jgi:hypothetical protein
MSYFSSLATVFAGMLIRPSPLSEMARPAKYCTPTKDYESIEELVILCAQGKLYEVEQWIAEAKPIQCEPLTDRKMQKKPTPLSIVVRKGFYSLAELLLFNGYNPNGDYYESLKPAVETKNQSMVELLFRFGADPKAVDFSEVLGTFNRGLMDCFIAAGVDPCADNAVAKAFGPKARPLLGFVKTYKERFPGMQRQIDIALHSFVDQEDEKGVCLMLWLGANPYANVPKCAWDQDDDVEFLWCPLQTALIGDREAILLHLLKVPPPSDRVQKLLHSTSFRAHPEVVRRLLRAGADPNDHCEGRHLLDAYVRDLSHSFYRSGRTEHVKHGLEALRLLAQAGAKWDIDNKGIAEIRRSILDAESSTVNVMMEIFRINNVLNNEQLEELTRTPAMKRLMAGNTYPKPSPLAHYKSRISLMVPPPMDSSPTRNSYWKQPWYKR